MRMTLLTVGQQGRTGHPCIPAPEFIPAKLIPGGICIPAPEFIPAKFIPAGKEPGETVLGWITFIPFIPFIPVCPCTGKRDLILIL